VVFVQQATYDPFAGSGTTLVEANALGIDSIGTDISIFNVLLSRVKTADYDIPLLEKEIHDISKRLGTYKSKFFKDQFHPHLPGRGTPAGIRK